MYTSELLAHSGSHMLIDPLQRNNFSPADLPMVQIWTSRQTASSLHIVPKDPCGKMLWELCSLSGAIKWPFLYIKTVYMCFPSNSFMENWILCVSLGCILNCLSRPPWPQKHGTPSPYPLYTILSLLVIQEHT